MERDEEMRQKRKGNLILLLTAMVWGLGFVAQKAGAELQPFTYNGIRMLLGGVVLLPVVFLFMKNKGGKHVENKDKQYNVVKSSILGGIICGVVLCIASNLQQFGIYFQTDASKAGFITSLYILFVPILSVFFGKKVRPLIWGCVFLGGLGFYLLTMAGKSNGFVLEKGDLFVLICAFVFAWHIIVVDFFATKANGLLLSSVQFITAGILSLILMGIFEQPDIDKILSLRQPILYSGLVSTGIGYTLQVVGQKDAEPTTATLIMSLESVFAVIFGVLLMHERITLIEGIGCLVIFIAVVIPQLPQKAGDSK